MATTSFVRKSALTGDRELLRTMRQVGNAPTGRVLDRVMTASLEPLKSQTEENARPMRQPGRWQALGWGWSPPVGGHLDQGVAIRKVAGRGAYYREFWTGFVKRARRIAHLVEFGTAPHYQPKRGFLHPGARPYPFFRPAFEETKGKVVLTFGQQVWGSILSAVRYGGPDGR